MQKNIQRPLQLATAFILCVVGGLYWYAGQQQDRYDTSATQYLRTAFTDISSWQRAALQRQMTEDALRTATPEQLDALTNRYRPLGHFIALSDAKFTKLTAAMSLLGPRRLLSYHGSAQFEHGNADFAATLVIRDDGFRFYNLNFSSPQLR
ncbi:MAG: hypothetical protein JWM78_3396 [Verrucomicrobiaceae bacterium]|nr:hypothetical protein [Verrucomicrobiaceae bacterium]